MVGMQHKIFQRFLQPLFSNVFMLILNIYPRTNTFIYSYKFFFQEEFPHRESGQALERVAQEGGA